MKGGREVHPVFIIGIYHTIASRAQTIICTHHGSPSLLFRQRVCMFSTDAIILDLEFLPGTYAS